MMTYEDYQWILLARYSPQGRYCSTGGEMCQLHIQLTVTIAQGVFCQMLAPIAP